MKKNKLHNAVLFALMSSSLTLSAAAMAQQAQDEQDEQEEQEETVERLKVTGSRLNQSDLETASPVVIIGEEDIKNRGFTTAFDALKNLTQNTGYVQGDEFGAQGGFTPNAQTISLRNFAPGKTLVLLNGRRMSDNPTPYNGQSNFVNLSSIPVAAIDRIEVLTNGASAIYGSDAVAGVVNIILKSDVDSTTVSLMAGTTKDGGGDEKRLQIVSGISESNFSVTYGLEYHKIDPIFASDRDWLDSYEDRPDGNGGPSLTILVRDAVSGMNIDPGTQCVDSGSGWDRFESSTRGFYCGGNTVGSYTIQNEREKLSAFASATYDISNNTEAFLDTMYTKQEALNRGGHHFAFQYTFEPTPDGSGNYGYNNLLVKQRIFSGEEMGYRGSVFNEDTLNITTGLRGVVANFYDWEISYSRSQSDFEDEANWMKNEVVWDYFFGNYLFTQGQTDYLDGQGQYDFYAPITSDMRSELLGVKRQVADSMSETIFGSFSGDLFEMPAGTAQFALIAEYNTQDYSVTPDERTLSQTEERWWGLTGTTGGGERDRWALGFEMSVPLLETLTASLAGRYDKYDDDSTEVGGRFTPMIGIEYRPLDELLVRGTYGKSFRAPDMHYVFAGDSGYYSSVYDWVECREDFVENGGDPDEFIRTGAACEQNSVNFKGTRSGSKVLKEEEGTNWGLGVVYDITDDLNFSIDYYSIELENIVTDESASGLMNDEYECKYSLDGRDPDSGFCQLVFEKVVRAGEDELSPGSLLTIIRTPTNAETTKVRGIDATINYALSTSVGDFSAQVQYSNVLEDGYKASAEDDYIDYRDNPNSVNPRTITNATFGYSYQDFSVYLTARRMGSVPIWTQPAAHSDPDSDLYTAVSRTHPWVTYNLSANYSLTDESTIRFSGSNIFNKRPPRDDTYTGWPYYNIYTYGGGSRGASYYVEYIHRF